MCDVARAELRVEVATPEDWPWMLRAYERTAWSSLPESLRLQVSRRDVRARVLAQGAAFREAEGRTLAALLARDSYGHRAGFLWVEENRHGFTGEARAYVLELYVSRSCRGRGVGRMLMEAAEAWARARGLARMALNVAAHNHAAVALYERLGYSVETLRLGKTLEP